MSIATRAGREYVEAHKGQDKDRARWDKARDGLPRFTSQNIEATINVWHETPEQLGRIVFKIKSWPMHGGFMRGYVCPEESEVRDFAAWLLWVTSEGP